MGANWRGRGGRHADIYLDAVFQAIRTLARTHGMQPPRHKCGARAAATYTRVRRESRCARRSGAVHQIADATPLPAPPRRTTPLRQGCTLPQRCARSAAHLCDYLRRRQVPQPLKSTSQPPRRRVRSRLHETNRPSLGRAPTRCAPYAHAQLQPRDELRCGGDGGGVLERACACSRRRARMQPPPPLATALGQPQPVEPPPIQL
eukprot:6202867-Pleurochrysis_carterae.AAC.4